MPFKTASGKLFYRVGDVIISTNSENPSTQYGGSWTLFAPGRTLVCIDTSQGEFNAISKVGGNKYLQNHSHSASSGYVSNDHSHYLSLTTSWGGDHKHRIPHYQKGGAGSTSWTIASETYAIGTTETFNGGGHSHSFSGNTGGVSSNHTHGVTVNSAGNGNTENLQPFIVVYFWVRIS